MFEHEFQAERGPVLEELRRELAVGLVRSKDLAIYEVAYLLGYSEPST